MEQRLAHDEGLRQGLAQQIEQLASQRQELATFVEAARVAEQRAADEQRRLLLEVDRERGHAARLQKELDALKTTTAKTAKVHADKLAQSAQQVDELRQHSSGLEVTLASLRAEHAQLQKLAASGDEDRHSLTRLRSAGSNKGLTRRRMR